MPRSLAPVARFARRLRCFRWWTLACALAAAPAPAVERDFYFHRPASEDGLAQNSVGDLHQDARGFVWIATQGGLHRFDGYRFIRIEHRPGESDSLPDSFVTVLASDETHLYIGTNTRWVAALDLHDGSLRRYLDDEAFPIGGRSNSVRALLRGAGDTLWVGTGDGIEWLDTRSGERREAHRLASRAGATQGVWSFARDDRGRLLAASSDGLLRLGEAGEVETVELPAMPLSLLADPRGPWVWIGTTQGLLRLDPDGRSAQVWPGAGAPPAMVTALEQDLSGRLWLALHARGLLRLDPESGETIAITHDPDLPAGLPEPGIQSLMLDRSGLLWLGGQVQGLAMVEPEGAGFRYLVDLQAGKSRVASNNIRSIHEDARGDLWLGTEGDGIKRYDRRERRFESFAEPLARALAPAPAEHALRVYGIGDAGEGRLWVATSAGLVRLDPERRQAELQRIGLQLPGAAPSVDLRALLRARDGSLWLGSYADGALHFDPGTGRWRQFRHRREDPLSLSSNLVLALHEDRRGRIWVGTLEGLNRLDPATGAVLRATHDPRDPSSLSGNLVRSFFEDSEGRLWVGTHGGLSRLLDADAPELRFQRYTVADGLPDATVYAVLQDQGGRVWMSSNRGVARLDPASGAVRAYGLRHGLQGLEFNGGASARLSTGELVFGGLRGVNLFRPDALVESRFEPPLVVTAVQVGGEVSTPPAAQLAQGLVLHVGERILRFHFAALDYTAPRENRFAYRLDGFDADWVEAGNRAEATYTNLDPGSYVFRVRGSNHDGVFSAQELQVPVRVLAAWWATPTARAAYVLIALALVTWLVLAQRRKRESERALLAEIREREDRLKLALWGSGDEFWDWNVKENSLFRIGADQLLGFHREQQLSTDEWRTRGVHPDDLPRVQRILQQHIVGATEHFESEHRVRNARGEWIWVRSRGRVVSRDADGNPLRIAGTARDITANRDADHERRIALEVLSSMSEAVCVIDLDFRFVSVNPAFCRMTGYEPDEAVGLPSSVLDSEQHSAEFYRQVRMTLAESGHWQGEMWQRRKDGEEFLGWIELSEVRDSGGHRTHYVAVVNDVTDKRRAEQELRYLANYDTLTGLPNRTLLSERLARAVVRARRMDMRVAVLFLDLDRFKDINDSMGHAAGDRILKSAAARLLSTVRETDTVARLGGDEFTVVLEEIVDIAEAERVARKIIDAFAAPLDFDGRSDVSISPSIGISLYPDHGLVPTDLLKFADTAMYQAKERGRNTFQIYTEAMDAEARRRATLAAALRKAIDRGEFHLVYQPRLSLLDARITGVEALLRWHSADLGEVPPSTFIPLAEETGLILPIGEWVLREACYTLHRWRHQGLDIGMAVNVSVLQLLRADLAAQVSSLVDEIGIPADRLELEVTESMVMANAEQTISVLRDLKRTGVSLAIDDFGTGYSSLVYLKRLPIDTLKIDKEFIGDLTTDPDDEAITATIITMAHSLGLNVVAEGVELPEQLYYLREQGCDEIQGFWLSRPLEAHHCLAFIRDYRPEAGFGQFDLVLPGQAD
jgi:diguanylate cyclase (GGDEF)-like protein/PAS domain S-box-containing protein